MDRFSNLLSVSATLGDSSIRSSSLLCVHLFMNISSKHAQKHLPGLDMQLSAARVAWLRRNSLYSRLSPSTSAVGSRLPTPVCFSTLSAPGAAVVPRRVWRSQPARRSPRDCSAAHSGADWRPPHLCGGVVASCEVLLISLCRACRLAGGTSWCRKPSNNGWLQPGAGGTPTETSPECFGLFSVVDLSTDLSALKIGFYLEGTCGLILGGTMTIVLVDDFSYS